MEAKDWEQLFLGGGIEDKSAKAYAKTFAGEKLTPDNLLVMDRDMLKEIGVTTMGDALTILQLGKKAQSSGDGDAKPKPSRNYACKMTVKMPTLHADMTSQQFRKFVVDWTVFRQITELPDDRVHAQLYSCADDDVQCALISTYPNFANLDKTYHSKYIYL